MIDGKQMNDGKHQLWRMNSQPTNNDEESIFQKEIGCTRGVYWLQSEVSHAVESDVMVVICLPHNSIENAHDWLD